MWKNRTSVSLDICFARKLYKYKFCKQTGLLWSWCWFQTASWSSPRACKRYSFCLFLFLSWICRYADSIPQSGGPELSATYTHLWNLKNSSKLQKHSIPCNLQLQLRNITRHKWDRLMQLIKRANCWHCISKYYSKCDVCMWQYECQTYISICNKLSM